MLRTVAMKTILIALGAVFLFLILIATVFIGYAAYAGSRLDTSSKVYVDECVPAIISSWSKDELITRMSPQLRHEATDEQIDKLFGSLSSKLGPFTRYDGAKGQANISYTPSEGQVTTASYLANATFQNGKAEIRIKLIRESGAWKIFGFHVEMKVL